MMREYDEITLKRVQQCEMSILKDFMSICDEYHLTYFALAGTGIGALRHKGFIPWDDDIDVGLPRKDYEKLIEVFKERYPDKYQIGNTEHMENYPLMTTRIMIRGTKFVEESLKDIKCDLGIFLDVYALDNAADEETQFKRQAWITWFWSKILILRHIPYPVLPFRGIKKKLAHIVCACVHYLLVVFRISPMWIYNQCKKSSCKFNHIDTKRMAYFCDTSPFINTIDKEKSFPLIDLEFEDIMLKFPKDIKEMLTFIYGDYMTLPPVEKRKNHYPHCLEFKEDK